MVGVVAAVFVLVGLLFLVRVAAFAVLWLQVRLFAGLVLVAVTTLWLLAWRSTVSCRPHSGGAGFRRCGVAQRQVDLTY